MGKLLMRGLKYLLLAVLGKYSIKSCLIIMITAYM